MTLSPSMLSRTTLVIYDLLVASFNPTHCHLAWELLNPLCLIKCIAVVNINLTSSQINIITVAVH